MNIINKPIRIAVIATNEVEDMEFIVPIDIWRRAKFIVDVVVCEIKNSFNLNYSSLKITALFNLKHTNLVQYDAIFLPGGPGYKNFLSPAASLKEEGESKLHLSLKKFFNDPTKWLVSICAAPIALLCILEPQQTKDLKFTSYNDIRLIGDFEHNWVDKQVVIDKNVITAQAAGNSLDLALALVESLASLELAQKIAKDVGHKYLGVNSF